MDAGWSEDSDEKNRAHQESGGFVKDNRTQSHKGDGKYEYRVREPTPSIFTALSQVQPLLRFDRLYRSPCIPGG